MTLEELKKLKIGILGLGVNNKRLADFLKQHKIPFEVFDNWSRPEELTGKIDNFDVVFRTPGLPFLSEPIQQAKKNRVRIYSQTKLFFDLCPAPIIGITGTKGKGTTASLLKKILEATGWKVWLGGNIGSDPFEFLDKISSEDLVVLELSSFQLQDLHRSPHVAVVLKITPEHLDHHRNFQEYVEAKKTILIHQSLGDFAILNYDNEVTRDFALLAPGKIFWNSIVERVVPGSFIEDEKIMFSMPDVELEICNVSQIKLLGRFNLENITAAVAASIATISDIDSNVIQKAVVEFKGLPHRLEFVGNVKGVEFYNDSFSTTPETAQAAISAFVSPIVLIIGGSEKKADYQKLAKTIAEAHIKAILPIGTTGSRIAHLSRDAGFKGRIIEEDMGDMKKIVTVANAIANRGDVVLLSPASASFDMFKNYKHRGELFKKFVLRLR